MDFFMTYPHMICKYNEKKLKYWSKTIKIESFEESVKKMKRLEEGKSDTKIERWIIQTNFIPVTWFSKITGRSNESKSMRKRRKKEKHGKEKHHRNRQQIWTYKYVRNWGQTYSHKSTTFV